MSQDIFKTRGAALEDAFFRRVDDELAQKLREKWAHERDVESLKKESHIQDEAVLEELLYIGIESGTLQAMSLVPAVHVAWANGFVEKKEREAVLHAADTMGISTDSTTGHLLLSWLSRKPSDELIQVWEDYVHAMKGIVNPTSYRCLHEDAVKTAQHIAKTAGGVLGIHSISVAEQRAIKQIDDAFSS